MKTVSQILQSCQEKIKDLIQMIPSKEYSVRLEELDHLVNSNSLWDNPHKAVSLMKERQKISDLLTKLSYFQEQLSFYQECLESMPEELATMTSQLASMEEEIGEFEFKQMMSEPIDNSPAILTITLGAGGLEAANWVSILLRMYMRWADANGFKLEILDQKNSEEHASICIDSVSLRIDGPYAYGYLKGEAGVHRLIRNSPFNSGAARHTSFAAVSVSPDIEDSIDIKIEDKDLDITCQTAGGPGGQAQNKISSAVRLKHIPSGIHFVVRTERSQHENRRIAMKMLKSKLYDIEMKKKRELLDAKINAQSVSAFGYQIRTTTMTPYQLIKDHRTDFESNDVNAVLDGDIGTFLKSYLRLINKIV